jgi:tetratricopeptide (TPR) repeat protein
MWEQDIEIPTYEVGKPDKNPMFLEKRVYQGSSGKVYPHPVIDKIYDEKKNKKYRAVFLENEYLQIMILPELGGRIQRALDKTNNYDFVYYNHVIKPALVGLAGPWISGGIEFNWPQHHRPSTFDPVDYKLVENEDGSKTVYVSEIEKMFRTKGQAGFTLYPGKAYLEIKAQLYNRTSIPQTFLWWANPAVAVNDDTQSVFPPDVHAVFDHGKRDVSKFPIATGTYYKMDYSSGVDISKYKNIPVPTSYMAYHSDYNFVGGYDHGKKAGILHVADHHISPGKKQWTWGCGDFGKAWDRNLTDEDGPYIELMTGVFTDNQPDFSWIGPYEEKTFKQYFMPYKEAGIVKNSSIDAAVNLEVKQGKIYINVYATSVFENAVINLKGAKKTYLNTEVTLSPLNAYNFTTDIEGGDLEKDLCIVVSDNKGRKLIAYKPELKENKPIPDPAKATLLPHEISSNEELYLTGLHLEQYRHATYEPESYYLEGLKRDPHDIRINNAYGSLLFRRGLFAESEKYFKRAVDKSIKFNPNPYDGEPYYNLGLSLKMQGKYEEAFDAFYKSVWNTACMDKGFYSLACIAAIKKNYEEALELVDKSIIRNYHNYKARALKSSILRKLLRYEEAEKISRETLTIDVLDFNARNELYKILIETGRKEEAGKILDELILHMRDNNNSYIELSIDYADSGFFEEAIEVLNRLFNTSSLNAMIYYYIGYYYSKLGDKSNALNLYEKAMEVCHDYYFPNKLEDILVLKDVLLINPKDAKVLYHLGNLWYDKKQYMEAISCWEASSNIDSTFPTVYRNLALAYYNKLSKKDKAKEALEKAFRLNEGDARVFLELDQLYKKLGYSHEHRAAEYEKHMDLVTQRDDLYLEYITILNFMGKYEKAREDILSRKFHPWEGGEGKVTAQYVYSHVELGKKYLKKGSCEKAIELLKEAMIYPFNLGEGKLAGAQENNINYFLGCAYEGLNYEEKAKEYFLRASIGLEEPAGMMFYNDQPADMIFYQGLALLKLKETERAKSRFNKLISYGEKHIFDRVTIDYFAVSLPDFLIFDEELDKKNIVHCHYLLGLGYLGLDRLEEARLELSEVIKLDVNHLGALTHYKMV